jgi:hypothetical protein
VKKKRFQNVPFKCNLHRYKVAACLPGRKEVFVFGGVASSSSGEVSGELFALDAAAMTWRAVAAGGVKPAPRAGAAGAVVGDAWFITGGGGADGGHKDTVALKSTSSGGSGLEWVAVTEVDAGSSLAAEGASVVAVGAGAALLAFGGYDGVRYSNDVHVMKYPTAEGGGNGGSGDAAGASVTKPPTPVKTKPDATAVNGDDAATGGAGAEARTGAAVAMEQMLMTPRKPATDVVSSVLESQLWIDPNGDPFNVVTAGRVVCSFE